MYSVAQSQRSNRPKKILNSCDHVFNLLAFLLWPLNEWVTFQGGRTCSSRQPEGFFTFQGGLHSPWCPGRFSFIHLLPSPSSYLWPVAPLLLLFLLLLWNQRCKYSWMFSTANQQWWNTTNQTCATRENIEDRDSRPESSSASKKISQLTFLRSKYIINRSNTALVGQKLQLLNRSINLDSFTLISFTFFLLNHCHTFFWKIRSKQISMVPSKMIN